MSRGDIWVRMRLHHALLPIIPREMPHAYNSRGPMLEGGVQGDSVSHASWPHPHTPKKATLALPTSLAWRKSAVLKATRTTGDGVRSFPPLVTSVFQPPHWKWWHRRKGKDRANHRVFSSLSFLFLYSVSRRERVLTECIPSNQIFCIAWKSWFEFLLTSYLLNILHVFLRAPKNVKAVVKLAEKYLQHVWQKNNKFP